MLRILMTWALCAVCVLTTLDGRPAAGLADDNNGFDPALLAGLRWRSIGPAVTGGRIVDFAIPERSRGRTIYAASASGGLWKTVNAGTTWEPVFERESSISIGDVALAPSNPDIVWVGTGEANNQRSSSWGDGLYKSVNGGKTWTHVGLRASQHIGRIVIHPDNPDIVYVGAAGPLWGAGKERGLFKTIDGGRTWTNTKFISEHTGFVDAAMDPSDSDVLYAAAYQRERRAYSFIGGGPEGGIYKTTDAGATWTKLTEGLPRGDVGRIGLAVSVSRPRTVYAVVQARDGGVFRSEDYGGSWTRMNPANQTPWYYSQIRVDPSDPDRVYALGTNLLVSDDGAKTFRNDGARTAHVDHHALWIDPLDSAHLVLGNDGGVYVSHDRGRTWEFMSHLPIAQFYAIGADMREPFYYVYGGTQDNRSWGGPSATRNRAGILNSDWYQTVGGDGFYAAIDPTDPNLVYTESQNGGLVRYDVRTGERKTIKPQPAPGAAPYRWNWSAPILISPHDPQTVYFAANYLFRSADRGDSWVPLGSDLTRQRDRDTLPLMGKVWGRAAISRHEGTAEYGNISTIDESPLKKGLLYVGTDDGVLQVSRDGGATWSRHERFPGVPDETYVSRVIASRHQERLVYATFDGHRSNDFKPYVLKSTDEGASWTSIASNLPSSGSVYVIREHHRNPSLLFVGTEFGVFFTIDGGGAWIPLKMESSLPTVSVHDLIVHARDNDLIIGTHGRSIFILDDITPLERLSPAVLSQPATIFPPRAAPLYNQNDPLGGGPRGVGDQGDRFFAAPNRPFGVTISYFLKEEVERGREASLTVRDAAGQLVRELDLERKAGIQRTTWDLRLPPPYTVQARPDADTPGPFGGAPRGPLVLPGEYVVHLSIAGRDKSAPVTQEARVQVRQDPLATLSETDYRALHDDRVSATRLQARVQAAVRAAEQLAAQIDEARDALRTAGGPEAVTKEAGAIERELDAILDKVRGPRGRPGENEGPPRQPSLQQRVNRVAGEIGNVTSLPTRIQRDTLTNAATELEQELQRLNQLMSARIPALHKALDEAKVPWTIGRPVR